MDIFCTRQLFVRKKTPSIIRMNNNVILNWPGIKVIRQVKVSTMIREHLGYLGRINKRIVSTDEIPGFGNLVSDWESGLNNLKNHRVIFFYWEWG